jgi:O-antigen/teichoic acid export membrane protein
MLRFGGNLTGFNVVNYFSRNLDNILIGRVWGAMELGLYAKAYQLLLLPINQINQPMTSVAMPALSRLQNQPLKYGRYYYKALWLLTSIGMPIVSFFFVAADKLIVIVLGESWTEAVAIFRILAPAAFVGTFNVATGWVFQSLGHTDRQLRWGVLSSLVRAIAFIIAIPWGAIGMASAYSLSAILLLIPRFMYCYRGTHLRLKTLAGNLLHPALASMGSALITLTITQSIDLTDQGPSLVLFVQLIFFCASYLLLWTFSPGKQGSVHEVIENFKQLRNSP